MTVITVDQIKQILHSLNKQPENVRIYEPKKYMIMMYERTDAIKVVDSAYPISWSDRMREKFGIRDIGQWGWGYRPTGIDGVPLPCCERSLTLLELLMAMDDNDGLIYKPNYIEE